MRAVAGAAVPAARIQPRLAGATTFGRLVHQEFKCRQARARLDLLGQQSIRHLSTGQLRRLFLARALVGGPDILLLDEPCSGLDTASRAQYLHLLDQLAAQGIQMIFVSHHNEDAPLCINREAHMEGGRLRVVL